MFKENDVIETTDGTQVKVTRDQTEKDSFAGEILFSSHIHVVGFISYDWNPSFFSLKHNEYE